MFKTDTEKEKLLPIFRLRIERMTKIFGDRYQRFFMPFELEAMKNALKYMGDEKRLYVLLRESSPSVNPAKICALQFAAAALDDFFGGIDIYNEVISDHHQEESKVLQLVCINEAGLALSYEA